MSECSPKVIFCEYWVVQMAAHSDVNYAASLVTRRKRGTKMRNKLCLVALAMSYLPLSGQTLGEITGQVTDATGALIAGANVSITNVNTNAGRSSLTTDAGVYAFPSLQPATYNILGDQPGFKTATTDQVAVQVQQTVRLDIALTLGQVSESIEVSGAAAQLQAENSTVGTVIDNERIVELPLNGRNYLQL